MQSSPQCKPDSPPVLPTGISHPNFARPEFPEPGRYADWAYQGLTIAAMLLVLASLFW